MSVNDWDTFLHIATGTYTIAGFLKGIKSTPDLLTDEEKVALKYVVDQSLLEVDDLVASYTNMILSAKEIKNKALQFAFFLEDAYNFGAELL